ncbi:MAG TPA: TIGR01777 family oxidoreductase [Bacteroidia bacterium]|nr:TIGR01777 family oxidoreductase [Bacteroidia bacterium]
MNKIIITGGSGLLGSRLVPFLKSKNFVPAILSRNNRKNDPNYFVWNPDAGQIDTAVLEDSGAIVHLAGAGIADKSWTEARKKVILDSRVKSATLLFETLKSKPNRIRTIISASAVGIYGDGDGEWKNEESSIDRGFLQDTCVAWENSVQRFEELGIRVVIFRIGVVLSNDGGAYPQMSLPIKFLAGAALGSGEQYISWIHIDDLCRMIVHALENENMHGVYNAVAPQPVTNREFYRVLAKKLSRPLWPFNVPASILKIILGKKAEIVLNGQRVANAKILSTGFEFRFNNLNEAIDELKNNRGEN